MKHAIPQGIINRNKQKRNIVKYFPKRNQNQKAVK